MKIFAFIILAILLIGGGSGCVDFHQRETSAFFPKGEVTDEKSFDGFSVKTYYSSGDFEGSFEILRDNKRVYGQHGGRFFFGGQAGNEDEAIRIPARAADITGNGKPNLVVYEFSGGAHCCFEVSVFELGSSVKKIALIDGLHSAPEFVDLDGDFLPEVILYDWTFAYWNTSFANSPAPKVILKYKGRKYEMAFDLMRKPSLPNDDLNHLAGEIKALEWWGNYPPVELWSEMLYLIYTGNMSQAWDLVELSWPRGIYPKELFLSPFKAQLQTSPFWKDVQKLNRGKKQQAGFSRQ
jgi:hypothetical protein